MAKLTDYSGRPTSGTVPFAVVAIVTDNVDPDALGRIKVKFPTLPEEPTSFWLRQVSPNAGKERGFYALPEVDDEVLVVFMQGSQDVGVIIGQFWNGVDVPPPEAGDGAGGSVHASDFGNDATAGSGALDTNDRRFWKSRSGHLFIFDDKDGSETVEIWDKTRGLSVVLDSAANGIQISSKDGNIEISAGGDITLSAAGHIKYKAGSNVEGEAGQAIKLKAGTEIKGEASTDASFTCLNFKVEAKVKVEMKAVMVDIKGSAMAKFVAGAMCTVEGSAMCKVSGGLVMIN
jgi:uncharacterized protein involved in type VI secretion and phage assembly